MVDRYGRDIAHIETSELTSVTEVVLRDGRADRLYLAADQLPIFRT